MNDNPFGEIPALPIVIPIGVLVFALLVWRLRARGFVSVPRVAVAAAWAVYAAGVLANTIFPIYLSMPKQPGPWQPKLNLDLGSFYEFEDALTNVVVFAPLGILLALVIARPRWWRVVGAAALCSLGIELLQLISQPLFSGGHIADVHDLLWNVVGGALGYGVFAVLMRIPWSARVLSRFRWQPTAGAQGEASRVVEAAESVESAKERRA